MAAEATPVLELRELSRHFGAVRAVDRVSATIAPGEYVCILGPSGCGKTTLLRMIGGFEQPTAGDMLLDGRSLAGVPPERRDVNVVFQTYALFPHMTVLDNIAFGPRMKHRSSREIRDRSLEALRLVRLEELASRLPHQLSGGQQQRVALARAIVNQPRLLLLDEPLSALDRHLRQAMQEELRALQRRTGITFLHITHDQTEAMVLADRLIVMRAGRFLQSGRPEEVYRRPATRFVAGFVGTSNLLEGAPLPDGESGIMTTGGLRLTAAQAVAPGAGTPIVASIRPEAIHILQPGEVALNSFSGSCAACGVHGRAGRMPAAGRRTPAGGAAAGPHRHFADRGSGTAAGRASGGRRPAACAGGVATWREGTRAFRAPCRCH